MRIFYVIYSHTRVINWYHVVLNKQATSKHMHTYIYVYVCVCVCVCVCVGLLSADVFCTSSVKWTEQMPKVMS